MGMEEKDAWRARMRRRLDALPPETRRREAEAVTAHVLRWAVYRRARTVMLYVPLPGELDTCALLTDVLAAGKVLALPRCGQAGAMDAVPVDDWRALQPGRFGLREPSPQRAAMPPGAIDLILVPGLAFDARGHRLGHGAGYYDRFLRGTAAVTAGLAYQAQSVPELPVQAHDVALHYCVTAQGICRVMGNKGDERDAEYE